MRIVLLHSPLLGPVTWREVAEHLGARGQIAQTPAWPRFSTITEDYYGSLVSALAGTIDATGDRSVVLVAHSGAGALVPALAAAARAPILGAIFADAILPHPGESWFDTAPPALGAQLRAGANDGTLPQWDLWWPPGALERLVPDDLLRARMVGELEPIPAGFFEEPAPASALEGPAAYLQLSSAYADEARVAGRYGWPVLSLPLHHLAPLTHPEAVARGIASLALRLVGEA